MPAETPLMRQYYRMKQQHPDAILLFRVGDFYETFVEDAVETSRILGITLTRRANGQASHIELAGFPYHALDTYLPRLVRAGKRVAICDQLENPKQTTKLVKRGITEVVTPGLSLTEESLSQSDNTYLAALHAHDGKLYGLSLLDLSTGEFLASEGNAAFIEKILRGYAPKEIVLARGDRSATEAQISYRTFVFEADDWYFDESNNLQKLCKQFGVQSLKGFGLEGAPRAVIAAGAILNYLEITHHTALDHLSTLRRIDESAFVRLDPFTQYSLELVTPMHEGGKSLYNVLNATVNPMGARLLRHWIVFPLKELDPIRQRQAIALHLYEHPELANIIAGDKQAPGVSSMGDLERMVSQISMRRASPRTVQALGQSLRALVPIREHLIACECAELKSLGEALVPATDLMERIAYQLAPAAPAQLSKGNVIADGVSAELDEYRRIQRDGQQDLLAIQQREADRTGISSLKVGFNNVFGYYLEVRNTFKDKVPAEWIRKQTLVSGERYITQELKEYEDKVLNAQSAIERLEAQLFTELLEACAQYTAPLQHNCRILAQLDVLRGFAEVAHRENYVLPELNETHRIEIVEGRHPVIEQLLPAHDPYIANSLTLDNDDCQVMLVTGPNMSGKSALLRQTALITLMAQIGAFVPATRASIGLVDAIFTRVGASDNISMGESTFMVEMQEAANILNNITARSLVLFDELGRGTSTFDGVSIAWAIIEYLHSHITQAKTLFATHYHELSELAEHLERVRNYSVSAKEVEGEMIFLRKLVEGASEHSFGIQVAKLAGMPKPIVTRASEILGHLEKEQIDPSALPEGLSDSNAVQARGKSQSSTEHFQVSLFDISDPQLITIRDELQRIDINHLTPIEAITKLNELKAILNKY